MSLSLQLNEGRRRGQLRDSSKCSWNLLNKFIVIGPSYGSGLVLLGPLRDMGNLAQFSDYVLWVFVMINRVRGAWMSF